MKIRIGSLKFLIGFVTILTLLLSDCNNNHSNDRKIQLARMYKLYISENQDSNGVWHEDPWTKGGTGYIIYDGLGHMAAQITQEGYKDFTWLSEKKSIIPDRVQEKIDSMSSEELKTGVKEFSSSYVYFANYTIDDSAYIVSHHRISSSIPAIW